MQMVEETIVATTVPALFLSNTNNGQSQRAFVQQFDTYTELQDKRAC